MRITKTGIKLYLIFILLLAGFTFAEAQIAVNSPYTRYGLGWKVENRFETRIMGMGGIGYGIQNEQFINPTNPASYDAFDSTTFIFQAGVFGTNVKLKNDQTSGSGNYVTISNLLFGFQVKKWWGTSFGMLPYSYVGYDIVVETEFEDIGLSRSLFQGTGGFNKLYWGNSFKIYKGLAVGFNAAYLFGTIERLRTIGFPGDPNLRNTRVRSTFTARDFFFDLGIQYRQKIKEKYFMTAGATFSPEVNIASRGNYTVTAYYGDIGSVLASRDTIVSEPELEGEFVMPAKIGVGFSLEQPEKWTAGIDFDWQNWDNFQIFGRSDSVQNSWTIALGGEIIPNNRTIRSYWERVRYRFGFRYGRSYYRVQNTNINEFGISFGMGLPIRRSNTSINLALEAGKLGTTDNGLIQENFIRFTLGVNIFERWFMKRKYF